MNSTSFRPTLYFNKDCPFCLKVKIFLLEAGLQDQVEIVEFAPGSEEEQAIKQMLATHFEKVTVPAAQIAPDEWISDSDAIIARLADRAGVNTADLPVLATYGRVALDRVVSLFKENAELQRQLA
ncbi:glutathione S-transferase N-terminal domain-containing protein [Novosphingobium sp. BL-52-GroH]|uniref:glutathione S-transferase N-terminal domain-containing protein n=1 Tax=Novosphingobium sp. BL-52-GroH TaxID=3349877 RepID=UPI00384DB1A4